MQHALYQARLARFTRMSMRIVQLACFVHLVNENVFEIRSCAGPSMYPTLSLSGDYLLCVRTPLLRTFLSRNAPYVNRGDLIDFVSPRDPTYSVCKRVIGIEGDVVLLDPSGEKGSKRDYIKIPAGYLWVVGDNLSNSNDSREYGPIPLGIVRGKIVSRIWPNPRWLGADRDGISVVSQ